MNMFEDIDYTDIAMREPAPYDGGELLAALESLQVIQQGLKSPRMVLERPDVQTSLEQRYYKVAHYLKVNPDELPVISTENIGAGVVLEGVASLVKAIIRKIVEFFKWCCNWVKEVMGFNKASAKTQQQTNQQAGKVFDALTNGQSNPNKSPTDMPSIKASPFGALDGEVGTGTSTDIPQKFILLTHNSKTKLVNPSTLNVSALQPAIHGADKDLDELVKAIHQRITLLNDIVKVFESNRNGVMAVNSEIASRERKVGLLGRLEQQHFATMGFQLVANTTTTNASQQPLVRYDIKPYQFTGMDSTATIKLTLDVPISYLKSFNKAVMDFNDLSHDDLSDLLKRFVELNLDKRIEKLRLDSGVHLEGNQADKEAENLTHLLRGVTSLQVLISTLNGFIQRYNTMQTQMQLGLATMVGSAQQS